MTTLTDRRSGRLDARDAVQAHGGLGFTAQRGDDDLEGPVEAIYRDSKIGEIYEGAKRDPAVGHRPPDLRSGAHGLTPFVAQRDARPP
jgi:hypothetical protein